jgi:hypothetical protein
MKRKKRFFLFERPAAPAAPAKPAERQIHYFDSTLEDTTIDHENGIIKGVSVITSGVKARGHDLEVDKKTLVQMLECAKGKRIKTKWNHGSGADAVNGHLTNFQIVGDRLRADWKLLKEHKSYKQALELATEMPECVGLSASFAGDPEEKGGRKFARCEELISTDLVADPAANPSGLFSSKVDNGNSDMAKSTEEIIADLEAKLEAQGQVIEKLEAFNEKLQEQIEASEDDDDEEEEEEFEEGEEEGEGEEAEGELAEAGPVGAELAAMRRQINNLTAHIQKQELEAVEAEQQYAFDVIEGKQSLLIQELEDLRTENAVLLEFQEKVMANGGASFSHPNDRTTSLSTNATAYEKRVYELAEGGMKRTEAIRKAMGEGTLYQQHLAAKGVVTNMGR